MKKQDEFLTIKDRLLEGMERLNISANELAARANVAPSTISGIIRQVERETRPSTLQKIARALDADPRYLAGTIDMPGSWDEFYRSNHKALAEDGGSFEPRNLDQTVEYDLGPTQAAFGAVVEAKVRVQPVTAPETDRLYLVEIPAVGRRIAYHVDPYLIYIDEHGATRFLIRTPAVIILGEVAKKGGN